MLTQTPTTPSSLSENRAGFIRSVYAMLGASLAFTAVGAYVGLDLPLAFYWPSMILYLVVFIATQFLHRSYPINIILLAAFTFITGLILGPSLSYYIATGAGQAIPLAAGTTGIVFGGLSFFAFVSKKDFSFLGVYLFVALLAMVLFSVAMAIFQIPFNTIIFSYLGVLIFSGYVLYDTSNLIRRYQADQAVAATIALYLDIINLFMFFLRIFAGGSRRD
jgi:modulator of FtsH protease